MLLFGVSGTGKTTFACDFPKPLFLIRPEEVEDGSRSVRTVPGVVTPPTPIVDPDQISDVCRGQRRTNRYKTVVLDGITRLQDMVVKKHMGLADIPVQQTWGMVPQADWNRIGITLKDYLRELLRLAEDGTHVVLVGAERDFGDEASSEIMVPKVMVALTPGTAGWVHETCDYNLHTFKRMGTISKESTQAGKKVTIIKLSGKVEFCLHVGPSNLYATKFRGPRDKEIPEVLVMDRTGDNFGKLDKLIKGE